MENKLTIAYKKLSESDLKSLLIFCITFRNRISDQHCTNWYSAAVDNRCKRIIYKVLSILDNSTGADLVWNNYSYFVNNREQILSTPIVIKVRDYLKHRYDISFNKPNTYGADYND